MALTWILFLIVVQLFSESTCSISVNKPLCGDLSLQYLFFLVPSSTEYLNLAKFLSTLDSATVLKTSEDEGMVRVLCDPKDWEEIYEYSNNRGIYFLHSVYCLKKSQYSALQELRLRRNKLGKLSANKAPDNYLGNDKIEDPKITRVENSLNQLNSDVSMALKNVRTMKTRSVQNKNRAEAGKSSTTGAQSTTTENPSKRSGSQTVLSKNTPPPNAASRKSGKKPAASKNQDKTITRRSAKTETELESNTLTENTFHRMRRYVRDFLTSNYNDHKTRERRSETNTGASKRFERDSPDSTTAASSTDESTPGASSDETIGTTLDSLQDAGQTTTDDVDATTETEADNVTEETSEGTAPAPETRKKGTEKRRENGTMTMLDPTNCC